MKLRYIVGWKVGERQEMFLTPSEAETLRRSGKVIRRSDSNLY